MTLSLPRAIHRLTPRPLGYDASAAGLLGRHDFVLLLGEERLSVRFMPPIPLPARWSTVCFRIGDVEGECLFPHEILQRLVSLAEPKPRAPMEAPAALLLLEMLLDQGLMVLEAAINAPIRFARIEPARESISHATPLVEIGFEARFDTADSFYGLIRLPPALMPELHRLAPSLVRRFPDPPVMLSLRIGSVLVSPAELMTLGPGFGLVLGTAAQVRHVIVAGDVLGAAVRPDGSRIVFEGGFVPLARIWPADWNSMTETPPSSVSEPHQPTTVEASAIEQLQISLTFELARMPVSLAELRTIGEGHVIDIGALTERSVSIMANGRRIGEGELVDLGSSVAIRVTRIITA
ncbi:FliM/FliN family flagellar motor switch protein [Gluconobacter sp. Dm-73]|uniref:FliM/FliN family flagellar motor switch protein n=1 Tax=Gluconobacter sp. Dm-73 TaxID=2799802 RepID=UPI001B8D3C5B|nr:FliM/FliN family flagellar motor switch protein [Gluconobacter sp. Dm-73]MBS1074690.1 FliM/FliN family flagellar motor switch protein [Gluconobacter sp. Dm-73]